MMCFAKSNKAMECAMAITLAATVTLPGVIDHAASKMEEAKTKAPGGGIP